MSTNNKKRNRGGYYPASADPITICVEHFHECDADGREMGEGRRIPRVSVPIVVREHRQRPGAEGLEVGRVSAGSLDLALNILGYLYPPAREGEEPVRCQVNMVSATAYNLHEEFCREFLAPMEEVGGRIALSRIRSWVQRRTGSRGG